MPNLSESEIKWKQRFFRLGTFLCLIFIVKELFSLCVFLGEVISVIGYAILIAYLLIGVVDWIQNKIKTKKRTIVVLVVYIFILLAIIAFIFFIIPTLKAQLKSLISHLPIYFEKVKDTLISYNDYVTRSSLPFSKIDIDIFTSQLQNVQTKISTQLFANNKLFNGVLSFAVETISFFVEALATIVISIYLLIDGPNIWNGLIRPLSAKAKSHADKLRCDLNRCLRGYFIGQIQVSSFSGLFVFIMYSTIGSKYSLLLAISQILLEIIPVIGGFTGIVIGITVILFQFGFVKAIICFGLYMFYTQIIKDNFIVPRVMGDAIGLHPVMVILVVLIGAKMAGISGVIFALPLAGLLNVIFDYYLKQRNNQNEVIKSM